jgi:hypothetical protein
MDKMAVSLPAGIPSGTVCTLPKTPAPASLSIAGVFAYCKGVFPFSTGSGSSAIPSPIINIYFIINPVIDFL